MLSSIRNIWGLLSSSVPSLVKPTKESKTPEPESKVVTTNREVLMHASPLYGNKQVQKGSIYTCMYHSYNYIRCRYKQSAGKFPAERRIEKIFSSARRKLGDLAFFRFSAELLLTQVQQVMKNADTFNFNAFLKSFKNDVKKSFITEFSREMNAHWRALLILNFNKLADYLKNEVSLKETDLERISFDQIKKYLTDYHYTHYNRVRLDVLTKDLRLDFEDLFFDFLQERTSRFSRKDVPAMIRNLGLRINVLLEPIYYEQQAKLNNLTFLGRDIACNIDSFLNAVEKYGPLVCKFPARIGTVSDKSFVKNGSFGFKIYDVKYAEAFERATHVVVVVGGEVNKLTGEFIYYIDPNKKYTFKNKAPVYRMSFENFKKDLVPLDEVILTNDGVRIDLSSKYFLFGKNGLNRTRDPVAAEKYVKREKYVARATRSS